MPVPRQSQIKTRTIRERPPPAQTVLPAQAKSRIEAAGYSNVSGLIKGDDGIWRGKASKGSTTLGSTTANVALDYQGNVVSK
jgi:putative membrane protein